MGLVPFNSYDEALDFLSAFTNYEKRIPRRRETPKLGLERTYELLHAVGDPHRSLRAVHIAGTKGKGSTAVMIERILRRTGARVGLYTSPHIDCERERIQVQGLPITEQQAVLLLRQMHPYLASVRENPEAYRPSFFEIFTAMAFLHFTEEQVDWAVAEVGLGGRLDATNVLLPKVCAVTPVSMDHMERLGDTLALIAGEKAGIIKPHVPVVVSRQEPEAYGPILDRAKELQAPVHRVEQDILLSTEGDGSFAVETWHRRYSGLRCAMLGEHQRQNAAAAVGVIETLSDLGLVHADDDAVRTGLTDAVLPGRVEVLSHSPTVVVDVAHNPASVKALIDAVTESLPHRHMILVFGCAVDKDPQAMLALLAPHADQIIVTRINSPKAWPPEDLAQICLAAGARDVRLIPEIETAVASAVAAAAPEDLLCVVGSFYLVGDARRAWIRLAAPQHHQAASA